MPSLILTYNSPSDPGGGNPERQYLSPVIGAGWSNLSASVAYSITDWSGSMRIYPGGVSRFWFNRYPQPPSPFLAVDPDPSYVTGATDQVLLTCNNGGAGLQMSVQLLGDFVGTGVPCAYGTRLKPAAQFVYVLTPGLIDAWLTSIGQIWMAPLFTAFWFTTLNVQDLCGTGPPTLPVIDLSTLSSSSGVLLEILKAVAWSNVCECAPGAPAPIPFPTPSAAQPTGWPAPVSFGCAEIDLCASVVAIQQQLAALSAQARSTGELVTLLQRYRAPFAWIDGATHSGLVDSGSFSVPRCVGLGIRITSAPTGSTIKAGNPPYIYDMGWVSISTPEGMIEERRIAQDSRSWFPLGMQSATQFNYFLRPGVAIAVTELYAEP